MTALRRLLLAVLVLSAASVVWRRLSRRLTLPCPTWLAGMYEIEGEWANRMLGTEATLDRIGLYAGQRVLEVGPGPGRLLIPAARRVLPGGEVVGLDVQPGMIERLEARAKREGITNLTVVLGDAAERNFPPSNFDVVYLCTVLGEIPDREAAIQQAFDALKPGGVLSITEILPDPHYQLRGRVQSLAEAAGFRFQALYGLPHFYTLNLAKPEARTAVSPR